MVHKWGNLQVVNINKNKALCICCNTDILNIAHFNYDKETINTPQYREELCKCKKCQTQFILHYDLFDSKGHIYSRVFTEDINNPDFNWTDELTTEQKEKISEHMEKCPVCCENLSQELLTDAWFKSFIEDLRKRKKVV